MANRRCHHGGQIFWRRNRRCWNGWDIAYLEPPHLIGGFARVFKEFRGTLEEGGRFLQNWLDGRTGFVGLKTLRLRGAVRKPTKD